jgi:hypothetical protein
MQAHRNPRRGKVPKRPPTDNPPGPLLHSRAIRDAVLDGARHLDRMPVVHAEFERLAREKPRLVRAVLTALRLISRDRRLAMELVETVATVVLYLPDEGP